MGKFDNMEDVTIVASVISARSIAYSTCYLTHRSYLFIGASTVSLEVVLISHPLPAGRLASTEPACVLWKRHHTFLAAQALSILDLWMESPPGPESLFESFDNVAVQYSTVEPDGQYRVVYNVCKEPPQHPIISMYSTVPCPQRWNRRST